MAKIQRNEPCPCGSGKKYKKCHGSIALPAVATPHTTAPRELRVRAFTDETGNSGTHLFDLDQPYFWTGTLVCGADIEKEGAALHATCLRLTEQKELHGNALGLSRIEKIAHPLCEFFSKHDCLFFFTRIEKMHLAATKLFDTLMDSGINKAVSNVHYAIRAFRLPLAVQLIQIMDDNDRHEFWEAYTTGDDSSFREILTRIRSRLLLLHELGTYHDRTVQLLRDGLDWGIANPKPLIGDGLYELDSPNIVAFSLLMSMFHKLHQQTGAKVEAFVHDEQNQFGRFLKEHYGVFKRLDFKRTITASLLDLTELPTFDCELVMRSSEDSIGLQLADVTLWLAKRFLETRGAIHGKCRDLAELIVRRGDIEPFTLDDMQRGMAAMMEQMEREMPWPTDLESMERGQKIKQEIEDSRQRRMKEPPDSD
jgi:SEC-C motif-containing protein/uncharacterized protein DUF3800